MQNAKFKMQNGHRLDAVRFSREIVLPFAFCLLPFAFCLLPFELPVSVHRVSP
jgi:hypothetical protein